MIKKINLKKINLFLIYLLAPFLMSKNRIINLVYVILLLVFFVKLKKDGYKKLGYEYGMLLFFIGIIIAGILSKDPFQILKLLERSSRTWLLVFLIGQYSYTKKEKNIFMILVSLGFLRLLGLGYLEISGKLKGDYYPRISGGYKLWVYTMWISIYVSGVLTLGFFKKKKYYLYPFIFLMLLTFYVLLKTLSRSSWVCIFVVFIVLVLVKKSKKGLIFLMILGVLSLATLNIDKNNKYLNRVKSIVSLKDSSNTGRIEIYKYGLKTWEKNKFGIGYREFEFKNKRGTIFIHAHNDIIEILSENGFIGLLGFLLLMYLIMTKNFKIDNKYNLIVFSGFLSMIVYGLFESPIHYLEVQRLLYTSLGILGYKEWEEKRN